MCTYVIIIRSVARVLLPIVKLIALCIISNNIFTMKIIIIVNN